MTKSKTHLNSGFSRDLTVALRPKLIGLSKANYISNLDAFRRFVTIVYQNQETCQIQHSHKQVAQHPNT